jgi:hypothetical protein
MIFKIMAGIICGIVMFSLGRSGKHKRKWFVGTLVVSRIIAIIALTLFGILFLPWVAIVLLDLAIIADTFMWITTLRELAQYDKFVWFMIVYSVPLAGWLLYRATELR